MNKTLRTRLYQNIPQYRNSSLRVTWYITALPSCISFRPYHWDFLNFGNIVGNIKKCIENYAKNTKIQVPWITNRNPQDHCDKALGKVDRLKSIQYWLMLLKTSQIFTAFISYWLSYIEFWDYKLPSRLFQALFGQFS